MTGVDSGRRDPWRPVSAGRGVGKRFAQPTDHPDPRIGAAPRAGRVHVPAQPG